jgi:ATP-binding cassette, subfamily B, bacterial
MENKRRAKENAESHIDTTMLKRLFRLLLPYRVHYAAIMAVIILLACLEAVTPLIVRYAVDEGIAKGDRELVTRAAWLYLAVIVLQAVFVAVFISGCARVGARVMYDLRRKMFDRLQSLSVSFFDKTPVGNLMSRMFSDSQRVGETLTWGAVDFVWGIINMVFMAGAMLYVDWKLALGVLGLIPLILLLSLYFQRRILGQYREVRRINSEITSGFNEGYMGVKVIQSLVRENAVTRSFADVTDSMFRASFRSALLSSMYLPIVHVIGVIGTAIVVGFGGSGVIGGTLTIGTLIAFVSYTRRFFDPANEIARIFGQLQETQAAAERVFSLLETKPEITDHPDAVKLNRLKGHVEFKKVWFAYDGKNHVLKNFSLTVEPGSTIALVGSTGSGKTTIMNLLMRFYDATRGTVMIDGKDIRSYTLQSLRSQMGIVLQTPHLFSGTIRENLQYGNINADDKTIIEASSQAGLHDVVMGLPDGYDTMLREGGDPLSTGQKQLVSLARAILADPAVFIMDEATSSIDTETEARIQKASDKLLEGRTAFIIAHRLTTIRRADRILVIQNGQIIENGSHGELLARRKQYYTLYMQQFMAEYA